MRVSTRSHSSVRHGVTALLCVWIVAAADGMFVWEEIRKVPVQRLAQNIERQLAEHPESIELRLNLARLYAMTYALKVTEFDARGKDGQLEAWFGHVPRHLPGPVREAQSREHQERARTDLARAVKLYAELIERAPSNATAHLGYAWALEQSGDKAKAIAAYRRVVEIAWPKDRAERAFWADPATSEAAKRLNELLDPVADAKELASLEEKQAELGTKARMITPIAIPLGPGVDGPPVAPHARVLFDADGSSVPRHWTWITPSAGWLVHDPDGDGRITSALQWFGNVTFWLFWQNGYNALAALDDDGDGQLRGPELAHLAIWQDVNSNGTSDPGEVKPLSAHRIVGLSCRYSEGDGEWTAAEAPAGVTFAGGITGATYDVILRAVGRPVSITVATQ